MHGLVYVISPCMGGAIIRAISRAKSLSAVASCYWLCEVIMGVSKSLSVEASCLSAVKSCCRQCQVAVGDAMLLQAMLLSAMPCCCIGDAILLWAMPSCCGPCHIAVGDAKLLWAMPSCCGRCQVAVGDGRRENDRLGHHTTHT